MLAFCQLIYVISKLIRYQVIVNRRRKIYLDAINASNIPQIVITSELIKTPCGTI